MRKKNYVVCWYHRSMALIVAEIGEAAFAAAQAEGGAMTFEQAAEYALETDLA